MGWLSNLFGTDTLADRLASLERTMTQAFDDLNEKFNRQTEAIGQLGPALQNIANDISWLKSQIAQVPAMTQAEIEALQTRAGEIAAAIEGVAQSATALAAETEDQPPTP